MTIVANDNDTGPVGCPGDSRTTVGFGLDSMAALTDDVATLISEAVAAGLFPDAETAALAINDEIVHETNCLLSEMSVAEALADIPGLALVALGRVRVQVHELIGNAPTGPN